MDITRDKQVFQKSRSHTNILGAHRWQEASSI